MSRRRRGGDDDRVSRVWCWASDGRLRGVRGWERNDCVLGNESLLLCLN